MTGKRKQQKGQNDGRAQEKQARTLDALIEFDSFNASILPQLRKMVQENWSPEKIRKHFAPMVQCLVADKALRGDFKAQKDMLDRHEGMAIQRVEQKTTYAQMDRKELAALALQKLKDSGVLDASFKVVKEKDEEA